MGIVGCSNDNAYNPKCDTIVFATKDNSIPLDSPEAVVEPMHEYYSAVLVTFTILCLTFVVLVVTVIMTFSKRQICKMAQPFMVLLICLGLVLMCVRVWLAAGPLSTASCTGEFWTANFGIMLIITVFGVKTWRVYMVTTAMKKVKISEMKCVTIVGVIMFMYSIVMAIHDGVGDIHVEKVTLVDDQFDYIQQLKCINGNDDVYIVLNVIVLLTIIVVGRMLWLTRKVASTISSTGTTATAVMNILAAIIGLYVIVTIIEFEPEVRQFLIGIVIVFLTIRVTWILYAQLVFNILLGYDLDKALQLKQMAWSILNVGIFKSAAKVMGLADDNASPVSATGAGSSHGSDDPAYTKAMAKFANSKNAGDLQFEIDKIKKEIAEKVAELACLENMNFASDNSGNNSSSCLNSSNAEEMTKKGPPSELSSTKRNCDVTETSSRRQCRNALASVEEV